MALQRKLVGPFDTWIWRPKRGYGPLLFGASIAEITRLADIRYIGAEWSVDGPQLNFSLAASDTLLSFESDKLISMHFFEAFRVNGAELVGASITEVKALWPELTSHDGDILDTFPIRLGDSANGLALYFDDGRLGSAAIYDPTDDGY